MAASKQQRQAMDDQAAGWNLLDQQTASNVASIDFDSSIVWSYDVYKIIGFGLRGVTNNVQLRSRLSIDNGVSYRSTAGDYYWTIMYSTNSPQGSGNVWEGESTGSGDLTAFSITTDEGPIENNNVESVASFELTLWNPSDNTRGTILDWISGSWDRTDARITNWQGAGGFRHADNVDGIQFYMSSGNISTGTFTLYGLRSS